MHFQCYRERREELFFRRGLFVESIRQQLVFADSAKIWMLSGMPSKLQSKPISSLVWFNAWRIKACSARSCELAIPRPFFEWRMFSRRSSADILAVIKKRVYSVFTPLTLCFFITSKMTHHNLAIQKWVSRSLLIGQVFFVFSHITSNLIIDSMVSGVNDKRKGGRDFPTSSLTVRSGI